jgi:hypothetical protein
VNGSKNVTLSLPDPVLRRFRIYAASRNQSMTSLMTEAIRKMVDEDGEYERAGKRFMNRIRSAPGQGLEGKVPGPATNCMSVEFVDTNIFVYAHAGGSGSRHERSVALLADLWERGAGALSTQVLAEFYAAATRQLNMTSEKGGGDHPRYRRLDDSQAWPCGCPECEPFATPPQTVAVGCSDREQRDRHRIAHPLDGPESPPAFRQPCHSEPFPVTGSPRLRLSC